MYSELRKNCSKNINYPLPKKWLSHPAFYLLRRLGQSFTVLLYLDTCLIEALQIYVIEITHLAFLWYFFLADIYGSIIIGALGANRTTEPKELIWGLNELNELMQGKAIEQCLTQWALNKLSLWVDSSGVEIFMRMNSITCLTFWLQRKFSRCFFFLQMCLFQRVSGDCWRLRHWDGCLALSCEVSHVLMCYLHGSREASAAATLLSVLVGK